MQVKYAKKTKILHSYYYYYPIFHLYGGYLQVYT